MRALASLLRRDLRLAFRSAGETALGLGFFVLALSLFPFGVGAAPDLLARIGAGIIWVLALLAVLLGLSRLWQADYEDGSLELMALAPVPLELLTVAKCLAHWLTSGLLLAAVSPLLAVLMSLPAAALWVLPAALLVGTPTLTLHRLDRRSAPPRQPPRQRAPAAWLPVRGAVGEEPDEQRPGGLGSGPRSGRRGSPGQASPGSGKRPWAMTSESATERPTIASRSETEKQYPAAAPSRAIANTAATVDWLLRTPIAAANPISGADHGLPGGRAARPGRRGRGSRRAGHRWRSRPWSGR